MGHMRNDNVPAQVLVVDDDALTCELIREILCSAGMEAASLTDSTEAASRLRTDKFHAIFLDVHMPPPDGIELARQIRASRANATSVIVMITGEEDRTVMARAFQAGVEFFLFKPVDRGKLLQLIRATGGTIERERRRFMRIRLRRRVSIDSPQASLNGNTLDLSLGGMLIETERTFPPGTLITVNLEIEPGLAPLRSAARIVRVIGTDCMGIQFETLGPKESNRLQQFLLPLILAAT
jgi:CheY-like chemotaxis protein